MKNRPNLKTGFPDKPGNLSERAGVEWDRLTAELQASGIALAAAHRSILSSAATICADLAASWKEIEQEGAYRMGKNGIEGHPALKRLDALRRDLIRVVALLGVRAPEVGVIESDEDLERILAGKL